MICQKHEVQSLHLHFHYTTDILLKDRIVIIRLNMLTRNVNSEGEQPVERYNVTS